VASRFANAALLASFSRIKTAATSCITLHSSSGEEQWKGSLPTIRIAATISECWVKTIILLPKRRRVFSPTSRSADHQQNGERFALAVPLAETLAAGWLLARAGLEASAAPMTLAPARPNERITIGAGGTLSGRASGVSFAQDCAHIALLADDGKRQLIALVDVKDCRLAESRDLAGDGSNTVSLDRVKPKRIAPVPDGLDATSLLLMGSAIRGVQTAGALETILSLCVDQRARLRTQRT
jgi:hypothetical protein